MKITYDPKTMMVGRFANWVISHLREDIEQTKIRIAYKRSFSEPYKDEMKRLETYNKWMELARSVDERTTELLAKSFGEAFRKQNKK